MVSSHPIMAGAAGWFPSRPRTPRLTTFEYEAG
jgi:hypothetical protein